MWNSPRSQISEVLARLLLLPRVVAHFICVCTFDRINISWKSLPVGNSAMPEIQSIDEVALILLLSQPSNLLVLIIDGLSLFMQFHSPN